MTRNLLEEATRALRDEGETSQIEARHTRTRVLSGLHQTRIQKRTRLVLLLPIAATFVAAGALAAASGSAQRFAQSIERWTGAGPAQPAAASAARVRRASSAQTQLSTTEPPVAPVLPTLEPTAPPVASVLPILAPAPVTTAKPAASAASADKPDRAFALYRAAHAAHFVAHDAARALTAWDAYLNASPNGQFAPEARYNRALSLIRLGRGSEARAALEPFAEGRYGGYRQSEASALRARLSE